MEQLFPDAPEDLTALGDEQLQDLLASFKDVSRRLRAGEIDLAETFGDVPRAEASAEAMSQWRAAADVVRAVRAELSGRVEAVEAFDAEASEIDAEFADAAVEDEPEADADGDADEDAADEDAEPEAEAAVEAEVLAAAATPRRVLYPAVPRSHRAEAEAEGSAAPVLVAASGLPTRRGGDELDRGSYARTVIDVASRRGAPTHHRDGTEERILVASAALRFPEERTLHAKDADGNTEKIRKLGNPYLGAESRQALVASGGICAPPTPFYDVPGVGVTSRPVRDSLPSFQAERGAVSVPSVSTIGDITTAITVIEAADDALGGTFATKSCQAIDCATWTDVAVGAIAHCREVGNLNARTWPEGVAHENDLTMVAWARTAEGRLLDRIDAGSLSLSRAAVYGASSTLLYALQVSRAGIISRLRLDPGTRFNAILPFWGAEAFSADLVNSQYGRFDTPPEQVGALLSRFGFNAVWHLDEGIAVAADTEVWPDEITSTGQDDWPGTLLIARVHPAGHFLYLDGGSLELGVVRDSTLNSTNDYQLFGESFENLAAIGPLQAAHRLAITVCPDGTVAAPDTTAITCNPS